MFLKRFTLNYSIKWQQRISKCKNRGNEHWVKEYMSETKSDHAEEQEKQKEGQCGKYWGRILPEFISSGPVSGLLCYHCCLLAAAHKHSREQGGKQQLALTWFPFLGHGDVSYFVVWSALGDEDKDDWKAPDITRHINDTIPPSVL